ncbi:MAG: sugar phosphate isomerase/epimerase [Spirochaetes bacterium]|nr:sugar phosphate isomerase/epimerase [Spirochaetota bacterium]
MIKKSINRWAYGSDVSMEECVRIAGRYGFDGVELNLEEKGDFSLDTTEKECSAIGDIFRKHRLEISSLCSLLFWKHPITSGETDIRDAGIRVIRKMVDFASILGVENILVVPGMVHADPPLDFGNKPIKYSEAYERALQYIGELADYAKPKGVVIGLENVFYNKFLITQMEYKRFFEDLSKENVKLYFDVGNTMLCGFPEDWIEYLGEYICSIHLKDFDKNINTLYGWKNIFQGHIDWANVARALKRIGYDGYLVGEPSLTPFLFQQEELIKTTASAIDRVREMIDGA